jgi:hypothetical protein
MRVPTFNYIAVFVFLVFALVPAANGRSQLRQPDNSALIAVNNDVVFNLRDFGAIGDGIADDGPALQDALNAIAAAGGGTLFVPAGRYAISTPVQKDFTRLAASLTIVGVESLTSVPPSNSTGLQLTAGLNLLSEFAPRTGNQAIAINISGLQSFLIQHVTFIGTPNVATDASVTLTLRDVWEATIKHCEFYGLSSLVAGGAIVQAVRSHLTIEETEFLGDTCNSGVNTSVVQNIEWKGVVVTNTVFADYGQRAELYGKLSLASPFSWVSIGNAAAPASDSPRREAVIRNVFFDEGALNGFSSLPYNYYPASAPIDLIYVSDMFMNVTNLQGSGNYFDGPQRVMIENSHYGWSHNADAAINLHGIGNAILDKVECVDSANRIRADADTGKLAVINSVYTFLDSESPQTKVITTETAEDDPVQYVNQQFNASLNRDPDAAAHFYWSDRLLQCGEEATCIAVERAALNAYLDTVPPSTFSIVGSVFDETGAGFPGVTITLSGSQSVTTETGIDGRYSFDRLPTSGVYTVTPSRANYSFNAPSHTIVTPHGNQTADFAATLNRYQISGHVSANGVAVDGVTVDLSGSELAATTTDAAGNYSFTVPAEGDYIVIPGKTNYLFAPASQAFDDLSANRTANFEATLQRILEFSAASYSVSESSRRITVTVARTGDTSGAAEVVYSATDGSAQQRSDVIPIIGRLTFQPGETSKSFVVFVTDDSYVEGEEGLMLELSDPIGADLGTNLAPLNIEDNDTDTAATNPIDDTQFFVRQQYRDFLNRSADAEGLAFWSNQISSCGTDTACIADRRMNVSAAFFLSIEFQQTGYLVYRLYRASFGQPPQHLNEFLLDTRTIGEGVVVNTPGWQDLLEANRIAFIDDFVQRAQFITDYPLELTPIQFVNQLNARAGGPLSASEFATAVAEFAGAATSEDAGARTRVLRRVAESPAFSQHELNPAFVLMQYFGYLQRNPDELPDDNLDGYNFWLNKLNEFGGDFRRADMVKSFLVSAEYRARFGSP